MISSVLSNNQAILLQISLSFVAATLVAKRQGASNTSIRKADLFHLSRQRIFFLFSSFHPPAKKIQQLSKIPTKKNF